MYAGFAKKVSVPGSPASILDSPVTVASADPSTVPFNKSAIVCAENSISILMAAKVNHTLQPITQK